MADRYILAVESSCDETSVAVLKNEKELLSNIIASQEDSHKRFGRLAARVARITLPYAQRGEEGATYSPQKITI